MLVKKSTVKILLFVTSIVIGLAGANVLLAQSTDSSDTTEDVSFWAELAFWESVKDSRNPEELRAYLSAYPEGRFVALARVRVEALGKAGVDKEGAQAADPATPANGSAGVPRSKAGFRPGDVLRDCDACPQLVIVPPGRFEMGSSDGNAEEKPLHTVDIPAAFAMGMFEVTVEEWDACLREGACRLSPASDTAGKLPMANVSWDDAQDYLKWLSGKTGHKYRLPTEAEWEYAARAGSGTSYWWGDDKGLKRASCTDCGNPSAGEGASPVGSFEANPFGLYDVHGNVWEWTQDCWNPSYQGKAPIDGGPWLRGDCLARVLRGGGWALDHSYMRASRRNRYDRDVRYYLNGFRVLRELPAPTAALPVDDTMPFDAAVLSAVDRVFSGLPESASGAVPQSVVIDPLVDGLSGAESVATRVMKSRILDLVGSRYAQFGIEDFTASGAANARYLVIGTFTGVNKQRKTSGDREAFRICLALLDLRSGKIASKAKVFSQSAGVDITPTAFFRDSPVWLADPPVQAYIKTCQARKTGDSIDPIYLEQVRAAALTREAIDAYEKEQYRKAQDLFVRAAESTGGDQLRTYNGLYLTSWKLGEHDKAAEAFASIVKLGLDSQRFAVKFSFRTGSADLGFSSSGGGQDEIWLTQIAKQTAQRDNCLEILGHVNRVGPELLNQRLSARRAEYIKRRLEAVVPALASRTIAVGKGSEGNLIGSRTADARDALDRRIEFDAIQCSVSK